MIVKVSSDIYVPNAFTPNGDGKNDIFYVSGGPRGSMIKNFSIFNRWGEIVFDVHDVLPGECLIRMEWFLQGYAFTCWELCIYGHADAGPGENNRFLQERFYFCDDLS
ncbi:MAG: gliding motility-associated C-terminal domain-containing protein [Puia sp.]